MLYLVATENIPKRTHYDLVLDYRVIISAQRHGSRATEDRFEISEANIYWQDNNNSIFSCKPQNPSTLQAPRRETPT